jgi:hypothetical protein
MSGLILPSRKDMDTIFSILSTDERGASLRCPRLVLYDDSCSIREAGRSGIQAHPQLYNKFEARVICSEAGPRTNEGTFSITAVYRGRGRKDKAFRSLLGGRSGSELFVYIQGASPRDMGIIRWPLNHRVNYIQEDEPPFITLTSRHTPCLTHCS